MSKLLTAFSGMVGNSTAQQWVNWCIPTAISNALRLLGSNDFPKERIRDLWYQHTNRQLEQHPRQQFTDGSRTDFNITNALISDPAFSPFTFQKHHDQDDTQALFAPAASTRAEKALAFIRTHVDQDHPVVVSTWDPVFDVNDPRYGPNCCHMWLVLDCVDNGLANYHDSGSDKIETIPTRQLAILKIGNSSCPIDTGLLGRITRTDYGCLALWKK